MQEPLHEERQPDDPRQQSLDFVRGEQLRILQDCELPKDAKDKTGHGVRASAMKSILNAIDHYGRGRSGGAFASVRTLAATANVGPRTATRAIEVLQALGLICVTNDGPRYGHTGSPTNRYTIVWSELAVLVDRTPLARHAPQKHCAPDREPERPGGRPERPGGRPERPGGRPERPGGALNDTTNDLETYKKRRRNDVSIDEDGAREFSEDEVAAVREKANTINAAAQSRTLADRELVLKIATLWLDGELPEDAIRQVLESYERAKERGTRIKNAMSWLWTTLNNQCWRHSLKLEFLLATTDFPRQLLPTPAMQAVGTET